MMKEWLQNNKPNIFGCGYSIYYHILARRYCILKHPGRASMMNTMVTTSSIQNIQWTADDDVWVDIDLWRKLNGITIDFKDFITLGMKHGKGLCGGVGHNMNFGLYTNLDFDMKWLHSIINNDILFYKMLR
jgi:hypothetical protein